MSRNQILGLIGALVVILGISFFVRVSEAPAPESQSVSNETDTTIRAQVEAFGRTLKHVSLLAPDAAAQIDAQYGAYVAPELLQAWKSKPENALGRQTPSPWPERIEVVEVRESSAGTYTAEGNVIEVTNAGRPLEPAGIYPVSLILTKSGDKWLITSATKGAYSTPPQRVSVEGMWECLPHRNASGPQTLECAFGIALLQSDGHLAISTNLMSSYPVDFAVGTQVRVEGIFVPKNQLNTNMWNIYDIDGIVEATSITKLQ